MQGKTLYTILLAIIAVLTLALAVLVIFLFTTFSSPKSSPTPTPESTEATERTVPTDEQAEFNLYATAGAEGSSGTSGDAVFSLKSTTDHPSSYLLASIYIFYDAGPKNSLLEKRKTLLEKTYLSELKQATIEYFLSQSYTDIKADNSMQKARDTLIETYNKILTGKTKQKIVIKIVFDKWIPQ